MANNPRWAELGADANAERASNAGRQQAALARRALAVLAGQVQGGVHVQRWIAALEHRIANPHESLAELGASLTPPMTKHAYAALLRRALAAAGVSGDQSPSEPRGKD